MPGYDVKTLSIFRFSILSSDTATYDVLCLYSFEVRSSCICSQLENVDLHKILKFPLLVRRNILQDLPRNL